MQWNTKDSVCVWGGSVPCVDCSIRVFDSQWRYYVLEIQAVATGN